MSESVIRLFSPAAWAVTGCSAPSARCGGPGVIRVLHPPGYVSAIAWSPSGTQLAAVSDLGGLLTLWDVAEGRLVRSMRCRCGLFGSVAFLDENRILTRGAGIGNGGIDLKIWNAGEGTERPATNEALHGVRRIYRTIDRFCLSPDRRLVAVLPLDRSFGIPVDVYRTEDWTRAHSFSIKSAIPLSISLSNRSLAIGAAGGKVFIFHLAEPPFPALAFYPYEGISTYAECLAFSSDGKRLATGPAGPVKWFIGPESRKSSIPPRDPVRVWNTETGRREAAFAVATHAIVGLAWRPDGKLLASATIEGLVQSWDIVVPHRPASLVARMGRPEELAFSPNGKLLAACGPEQIPICDPLGMQTL